MFARIAEEIFDSIELRVDSLSEIAASELCALMWLGRDYYSGMEDTWDRLVQAASLNNPMYVAGKTRLFEYLRLGLKHLGLEEEFQQQLNTHEEKSFEKQSYLNASEFSSELYKYLSEHPEALHSFSPRRFEELVADILNGLGYEVHLTKQTKDGGRDILAYFTIPSIGKILTIVECKNYAPKNVVGIDIVERFLYAVDRKDDASLGMLLSTRQNFLETCRVRFTHHCMAKMDGFYLKF